MFDPDSDSTFTAPTKEARNYVKFYRQWVRNNFKSKEAGREMGEERDFVIIISPGNSKTEVRRQANDADRREYSAEWSAYLQGKEQQISGTPIELLPGLPHGMADALKAQYIYTIEQMAGLSDVGMQHVGMGGNDLRNKARAYLQDSGAAGQLREQLERAEITITTLTTANAALTAKVAELEAAAAQPKRRGRKPKLVGDPAVLQ